MTFILQITKPFLEKFCLTNAAPKSNLNPLWTKQAAAPTAGGLPGESGQGGPGGQDWKHPKLSHEQGTADRV